MTYCIVDENNIVTNLIICSEENAKLFGAKPYYEGAEIGKKYNPPSPLVDFEQRMKEMEDTLAILLG